MELLKQPQYSPYSLEHEVELIYAGTRGYLDEIAIEDLDRWIKEFTRYMDTGYPELSNELAAGNWTDETEESLAAAIVDFNKGWSA